MRAAEYREGPRVAQRSGRGEGARDPSPHRDLPAGRGTPIIVSCSVWESASSWSFSSSSWSFSGLVGCPRSWGASARGCRPSRRDCGSPPRSTSRPTNPNRSRRTADRTRRDASRVAGGRRGRSAANSRRRLHRNDLGGELLEVGRRRREDDQEVRLLAGLQRPVLRWFQGLEQGDLAQRELPNVPRRRPAEDDLALLPGADDAPLDLDGARRNGGIVGRRSDDDEDELVALHTLVLAVHVRQLDAPRVESRLDHPWPEHGERGEQLAGRVRMRVDVDGENRVAGEDRE